MPASKQPRKQRKNFFNQELHQTKRYVRSNLSKELREETKRRTVTLKTGDTVKLVRGTHKNKEGNVTRINRSKGQVYVEGVTVKKGDASDSPVPVKASNLVVKALDKTDAKRFKR